MLDQLCAAKDAVTAARIAHNQGNATYDEMRAAAVAYLTLRQEAERAKFGKAKTKINAVTIASTLR